MINEMKVRRDQVLDAAPLMKAVGQDGRLHHCRPWLQLLSCFWNSADSYDDF